MSKNIQNCLVRTRKKIVLVVFFMLLVSRHASFSHPVGRVDFSPIVGKADFEFQQMAAEETIRIDLAGIAHNFSNIFPEIQLRLGKTLINVDNLVLTDEEWDILADLLHGFSLVQRVQAWGLTAKIRLLSEEDNTTVGFDIRDLETFEGDMMLNNEQLQDVYDSILIEREYAHSKGALPDFSHNHIHERIKRKITRTKNSKWPKKIPWRFVSKYKFTHKIIIMRSLQNWERQTCLRFIQKKNDTPEPHMAFIDVGRCYAAVGMYAKNNGQPIAVTGACMSVGSVSHEIGHSLGMWHEQSRPDRDDYVKINKQNMDVRKYPNFYKYGWGISFTAEVPYDYGSIMHYGAAYFGTDGKDTLTAIWPHYRRTMGDRSQISFYDAKAINNYFCSESCNDTSNDTSLNWSECEHDGYRDPNNCSQCVCQVGWAPPFCKTLVMNRLEEECGEQLIDARRTVRFLNLKSYFKPPFHYQVHTQCVWIIKAPAGLRVRAQFYDALDITCPYFACVDYVEIRYGDLARIGPRFCCNNLPNATFQSHGRELMVFFKALAKSAVFHKGFIIKFRAESCGGCNPAFAKEVEPVCMSTIRYSCVINYLYKCSIFTCSIARHNICYRVAESCCAGYRKIGTDCIRIPTTTTSTTPTMPSTEPEPTADASTTSEATDTDMTTFIGTDLVTTTITALNHTPNASGNSVTQTKRPRSGDATSAIIV